MGPSEVPAATLGTGRAAPAPCQSAPAAGSSPGCSSSARWRSRTTWSTSSTCTTSGRSLGDALPGRGLVAELGGVTRTPTSPSRHGYAAIAATSLRFFPLVPLLARPFIWVGVPAQAAVVIVSNVSALVAGMLLFILARRETSATRDGRRRAATGSLRWRRRVRARDGVHGGDDDRARGRDVPRAPRRRWWTPPGSACLAGLSRPSRLVLATSVPRSSRSARASFAGPDVDSGPDARGSPRAARSAPSRGRRRRPRAPGRQPHRASRTSARQFGRHWLPYSAAIQTGAAPSRPRRRVHTIGDALAACSRRRGRHRLHVPSPSPRGLVPWPRRIACSSDLLPAYR